MPGSPVRSVLAPSSKARSPQIVASLWLGVFGGVFGLGVALGHVFFSRPSGPSKAFEVIACDVVAGLSLLNSLLLLFGQRESDGAPLVGDCRCVQVWITCLQG